MRALLVGRFQPPHRGHLHAIRDAARRHDDVLVAIGSSQHGHEAQNPLTAGERAELLVAAFAEARLRNVHLFPLPDLHRHAHWVRHVETLLPPFDVVLTHNPLTRRLFVDAGYRVAPVARWRPETCSGRRVRQRWRRGEDASDLLAAPVAARLRAWGVPKRVQDLAPEAARGRRAIA